MAESKKGNKGGSRREPVDLETAIREQVLSRDKRFELAAYFFIYEALAFTQKALGRDAEKLEAAERHVSGQELLDGVRAYAQEQFGPLAPTVFHSWGIRQSSDFGELVFNLVESGLLGKTDSDRREDFSGGFDLGTAFDGPITIQPK